MQTILITGASRGLGREVARQLAHRGVRVILTARQRAAGERVAREIPGAEFIELDVTDPASVATAAVQVDQLDVLINNAAVLVEGDDDILTVSPERVMRTFATNTLGALRVAQAFVPHLARSPAGRIVNVSSGGGQLSDMGTWAPAYCISKAALNAVTGQLAAALRGQGIVVNSVCPGWCRTEMGGSAAPRSVSEGAAGIVWLALDAPPDRTGGFWRDGAEIPW